MTAISSTPAEHQEILKDEETVNRDDARLVAANDIIVVDFDGPDDPADPLNWSVAYKWSMVILISILSLMV